MNRELANKIPDIASILWLIIGTSMAIHILVLLLGQTLLKDWRWHGMMAHTGVEISGAIIAFFVAMLLLRDERFGRGCHYNIPIAAALLVMGIFDAFHALVAVGDIFVWLHSLATFIGGVFFVFICAPKRWHFVNSHAWWLLGCLLSCFIALTSVIYPKFIPVMVLNGEFTACAIFLNLFGGCLLFICAIKLVLIYLATKNVDDLLFCLHCSLFGAAAIMFQHSSLWDAPWWGWHFLRFMAYVFALWFVIRGELRAFDELDKHSQVLAQAVSERTEQLHEVNQGLQIALEQMAKTRDQLATKEKQARLAKLTTQKSLDDLTLAKDSLVQAEKMASLGLLVAGVAHEVNTPLGVCITSNSAIKDNILALSAAVDEHKLTKVQLRKQLVLLFEYQEVIERSLTKAANLIQSFKSLAVEQHTDPEVEINLSTYLHAVVKVVKTSFKSKNYHIDLSIDDSLNLITYPSAWNQILTHLLMNSHIHGFEERLLGEISIVIRESYGYLTLDYKDNGKGVAQEVKRHIFDPFVTTKRGQGSSGLGLNIVFNLVTCKLAGTIKCLECTQGCNFIIELPVLYPEQ